MGRIGRSYPLIQADPLARSEQSAASAYRRFFKPIAPFTDPVFDATERHKAAAGLLAGLTILGVAGWLLGLLPIL